MRIKRELNPEVKNENKEKDLKNEEEECGNGIVEISKCMGVSTALSTVGNTGALLNLPSLSVIIHDYDDDMKENTSLETYDITTFPVNVHNEIGTVSANSSPKTTKTTEFLLNAHIEATVLQIIDVLSVSESPEWAVLLIRETLHGNSEGNELQAHVKIRREESLIYCEKLLNCLVETLLKSEEKEENLMLKIKGKRSSKEQIVAIVVTIAVFCKAHPPFAIKHLSVLLPYLKVKI